MIAYVLSNTDLKPKDVFTFDDFTFNDDIDFKSKSSILAPKKPNVLNDDFIVCKDDNTTVFNGIVTDASTDENTGAYALAMYGMESLFDRQIFVGNEALIASTGIEDFIVSEINANWKNSGDTMLDRAYITASASTHTTVNAKAATIGSVKDGIYNLKTFIGNAKEKYGIFLTFTITSTALTISVWHDTAQALNVDTTISDVTNLVETYSVKALAKLSVNWHDTTNDTNVSKTYYLKTDRTITQNGNDPDRAAGTVKSAYIEAATESEMYESVSNEFSSNSYSHKVTFDLRKTSRVFPAAGLYVGRKVNIRTKSFTKTSIVTERSDDGGAFVSLVFGKLKVTLIDKLRG